MVEVAAPFEVYSYLLSIHGRNCACNRECQDRSIHVNSFAFRGKLANVEYQLTIASIGSWCRLAQIRRLRSRTSNLAEVLADNRQEKMYP
jgi:hypothetical protein